MERRLVKSVTPEEIELRNKQETLERLKNRLIKKESELAVLKSEIYSFEGTYFRIVGVRMAELDLLEAKIMERLAEKRPDESWIISKAKEARQRANESRRATENVIKDNRTQTGFRSSKKMQSLFRDVAKKIHPDLAQDENDRKSREELMKIANKAMQDGDEAKLLEILTEWHDNSNLIKSENIAKTLERVNRQIGLINKRISEIAKEITDLMGEESYSFLKRVQIASREGRDLLAEMAFELDKRIKDKREFLINLEHS